MKYCRYLQFIMLGIFTGINNLYAGGVEMLLPGSELTLWWGLPFVGILFSLSIFPLIAKQFWQNHFGKIVLFWGICTVGMLIANFNIATSFHVIADTYIHHFFPFIIFIFALYTISGGIKIEIDNTATPIVNTVFLSLMTISASIIGTTGAAMLFIRPFLSINKSRVNKSHLVIFFIFLVCNIGGSLSAIGDPPLFLGFLRGVDFFWATINLFLPCLTVMIPLIIIFYIFDKINFRREGHKLKTQIPKIKIIGGANFALLLTSVVVIILSGVFRSTAGFKLFGIMVYYHNFVRDIMLLIFSVYSYRYLNLSVRKSNHFTWEPFLEVFKIFAIIFITATPVMEILKAGENGNFASLFKLLHTANGPDNDLYFWLSGLLSAILDNAPTYLVFFNLSGGDAALLMSELSGTLTAISCGAVFMGALTYIGNAPNFMIYSIASSMKIKMPSFFGYMGWSILILGPLFVLVSLLWW